MVALFAATARSASILSVSTWGGASSEISSGVAVAGDGDGATYQVGDTFSFDALQRPSVFALKYTGTARSHESGRGEGQSSSTASTRAAWRSPATAPSMCPGARYRGDALVLKLSSEGSLVWQQKWGASGSDRAEAIAVGSDGSVYVVGSTSSFADATTTGHLFSRAEAPLADWVTFVQATSREWWRCSQARTGGRPTAS